jgi:Fe-S oxidoreductase
MREDSPSLLRGEASRKAAVVAKACVMFEEYLEGMPDRLKLKPGPPRILLHGHCHQKSMGLLAPAKSLLSRVPGTSVVDLDAGCCGMAGSFGYAREHFEVSRTIAERRLLPAVRNRQPEDVVVAAGTSCRHQVKDFTGDDALHPAVLLRSLL